MVVHIMPIVGKRAVDAVPLVHNAGILDSVSLRRLKIYMRIRISGGASHQFSQKCLQVLLSGRYTHPQS